MSTRTDAPRRPAIAYTVMEALLPASYFTTPPPSSGIRLTVTGADSVPTMWDLSDRVAPQLLVDAKRDPRVMSVTTSRYDDPRRR